MPGYSEGFNNRYPHHIRPTNQHLVPTTISGHLYMVRRDIEVAVTLTLTKLLRNMHVNISGFMCITIMRHDTGTQSDVFYALTEIKPCMICGARREPCEHTVQVSTDLASRTEQLTTLIASGMCFKSRLPTQPKCYCYYSSL